QRVPREAEILDDAAADEMFLDDPFRVLRGHVAIPRPLGVDDGGRALRADAQAVALRPIAGAVRTGDVQVLHPPLDVLPCRVACLGIYAVGAGAQEQVAMDLADAEQRDGLLSSLVFSRHLSRII